MPIPNHFSFSFLKNYFRLLADYLVFLKKTSSNFFFQFLSSFESRFLTKKLANHWYIRLSALLLFFQNNS